MPVSVVNRDEWSRRQRLEKDKSFSDAMGRGEGGGGHIELGFVLWAGGWCVPPMCLDWSLRAEDGHQRPVSALCPTPSQQIVPWPDLLWRAGTDPSAPGRTTTSPRPPRVMGALYGARCAEACGLKVMLSA